MTVEKLIKYGITTAGIVIALFLFPFLLKLFSPFIAAFVIAALCQRLVRFLERRVGISRGISSAILVTLIVSIVTGAVLVILFQLFAQIKNLIVRLPDTISSFKYQFSELYDRYSVYKLKLSPEVSAFIDTVLSQLTSYSTNISHTVTDSALNAAKRFAAALPGFLLFLTMFILGTFFFTKDYIRIINFFRELFSDALIQKSIKLKKIIVHAFSSYLKAQLILMIITALLVTVCLWIVGMDYPMVWGLVCGLVDALPFFGTAAVLVPWAVISLIYGDYYSFIALLVIQALTFVVRQLLEPKVVSKQIGIHPILTLVSVYIGLKYFGVAGVILAPIIMLLAVNLYVSYKENANS